MKAVLTESRLLARLAWPILVTQFAYMAIAATDTIMAGRLDTAALAAVGLANAVWVPIATFIGGSLHILLPLVSGHTGAGRTGAAGRDGVQGAWLGVLLGGAAAVLLTSVGPPALARFGVAPDLVATTTEYLRAMAVGMPFYGLWTAARFFCDGHSDTRPAMVTAIAVALLNAPMNLLLMHDDPFGLGPGTGVGLGVAGIGLATVCNLTLGAVVMAARAALSPRYASARLKEALGPPRPAELVRLLRRGAPIGFMFLAEYLAMSIIAVLIGGIGSTALAAHQIAVNVSMTVFMVPMSIAIALSIRVGMAAGAGDPGAGRAALVSGLAVGLGATGLLAVGVLVLAPEVAALYSTAEGVRETAAGLLVLAAAFQVMDAAQSIVAGALRGLGDIVMPFAVIMGAYWLVGLPLGWVLAGPQGVAGWWSGIIVAVAVAAVLMAVRARIKLGSGAAAFAAETAGRQ